MGLDVYVGSLTRYYAHDWLTIVQQIGLRTGTPVYTVRPNAQPEAIKDPAKIAATILQWMHGLSAGLGANIPDALAWNETAEAPYFTDKPNWDCYTSLLLWAAYSEHPQLARPSEPAASLTDDPAYQLSISSTFQTKYPSLLHGTEIWIPMDARLVFAAADPAGKTKRFSSVLALRDELTALNEGTWKADAATTAGWRSDHFDHGARMETRARFAFSIFYTLVQAASDNRLVMLLDY